MQLGHSNQDANSQSIDSFHHDAWFKVMAVTWHLTRPIQFWIGQSLKLVENDAVADYWIVTRRWTATQTFVHSLRYDHLYAAIYLIWGRLCIRLCWNVLFQCWPMFFFFGGIYLLFLWLEITRKHWKCIRISTFVLLSPTAGQRSTVNISASFKRFNATKSTNFTRNDVECYVPFNILTIGRQRLGWAQLELVSCYFFT